jgi:hypothetical protein
MAKRKFKEIVFDDDGLPLVEFLPGERYSWSELNDIMILMQLKAKRRLTLLAPDAPLCSACGVGPVYENNLCWDCLPG